jgi:hypothetical protein
VVGVPVANDLRAIAEHSEVVGLRSSMSEILTEQRARAERPVGERDLACRRSSRIRASSRGEDRYELQKRGIGIVGVIVIVLVILWLVGVIKL